MSDPNVAIGSKPFWRDESNSITLPPEFGNIVNHPAKPCFGDVDGGGTIDMVLPNRDTDNFLFLNDGRGEFTVVPDGIPSDLERETGLNLQIPPLKIENGNFVLDTQAPRTALADLPGVTVQGGSIIHIDPVPFPTKKDVDERIVDLNNKVISGRVNGLAPFGASLCLLHDFNEDDRLDLYIGYSRGHTDRFFMNTGDPDQLFTESDLPDVTGHVPLDTVVVDIEHDGDDDILLLTNHGVVLYINDGEGVFETSFGIPGSDDFFAHYFPGFNDPVDDDHPELLFRKFIQHMNQVDLIGDAEPEIVINRFYRPRSSGIAPDRKLIMDYKSVIIYTRSLGDGGPYELVKPLFERQKKYDFTEADLQHLDEYDSSWENDPYQYEHLKVHDVGFPDLNNDGVRDLLFSRQGLKDRAFIQQRAEGKFRFVEVTDEIIDPRNLKAYHVQHSDFNDDGRDDFILFGTFQPQVLLQTDEVMRINVERVVPDLYGDYNRDGELTGRDILCYRRFLDNEPSCELLAAPEFLDLDGNGQVSEVDFKLIAHRVNTGNFPVEIDEDQDDIPNHADDDFGVEDEEDGALPVCETNVDCANGELCTEQVCTTWDFQEHCYDATEDGYGPNVAVNYCGCVGHSILDLSVEDAETACEIQLSNDRLVYGDYRTDGSLTGHDVVCYQDKFRGGERCTARVPITHLDVDGSGEIDGGDIRAVIAHVRTGNFPVEVDQDQDDIPNQVDVDFVLGGGVPERDLCDYMEDPIVAVGSTAADSSCAEVGVELGREINPSNENWVCSGVYRNVPILYHRGVFWYLRQVSNEGFIGLSSSSHWKNLCPEYDDLHPEGWERTGRFSLPLSLQEAKNCIDSAARIAKSEGVPERESYPDYLNLECPFNEEEEEPQEEVLGDVNGDGCVDETDVRAIIDFIDFDCSPPGVGGELLGDTNADGCVDETDVRAIIDFIDFDCQAGS